MNHPASQVLDEQHGVSFISSQAREHSPKLQSLSFWMCKTTICVLVEKKAAPFKIHVHFHLVDVLDS